LSFRFYLSRRALTTVCNTTVIGNIGPMTMTRLRTAVGVFVSSDVGAEQAVVLVSPRTLETLREESQAPGKAPEVRSQTIVFTGPSGETEVVVHPEVQDGEMFVAPVIVTSDGVLETRPRCVHLQGIIYD